MLETESGMVTDASLLQNSKADASMLVVVSGMITWPEGSGLIMHWAWPSTTGTGSSCSSSSSGSGGARGRGIGDIGAIGGRGRRPVLYCSPGGRKGGSCIEQLGVPRTLTSIRPTK